MEKNKAGTKIAPVSTFCLENLEEAMQGERTQAETSSLPKLSRESCKSREIKITRICKVQYWSGELHGEKRTAQEKTKETAFWPSGEYQCTDVGQLPKAEDKTTWKEQEGQSLELTQGQK